MKYVWLDGTECEKEDIEEYLTFMSGDYSLVPNCFNSEDAKYGGECYFAECKWHSRDEPICGA